VNYHVTMYRCHTLNYRCKWMYHDDCAYYHLVCSLWYYFPNRCRNRKNGWCRVSFQTAWCLLWYSSGRLGDSLFYRSSNRLSDRNWGICQFKNFESISHALHQFHSWHQSGHAYRFVNSFQVRSVSVIEIS